MLPAGAVAAILAVGLSCAAAAGPGTPAGDSAGGVPWTGILLGLGFTAVALVVVSLIRTGRQGWGWAVTGIVLILLVALLWAAKMLWLGAIILLTLNRERSWGDRLFGGGFVAGGGATGRW